MMRRLEYIAVVLFCIFVLVPTVWLFRIYVSIRNLVKPNG